LVGAVVLVLVFAGFGYFSKLSERKAYAMFERGRSYYSADISGEKTSLSQEKASEQFEKVLRKYRSTNAAKLTLITYADMSYRELQEMMRFKNSSGMAWHMPMRPRRPTSLPQNTLRRLQIPKIIS
jgi:DNA-directed RNA polymerase specialized sigma24 family protein